MSEQFTPKYNEKSVKRIAREMGVSEDEARRIAATTMDGAHENRRGGIQSTQTACNFLHYSEHIQDSKGREQGEQKTLAEAAEALGIDTTDKKTYQIQREVDDVISRKYGLKK